MSLRRQLPVSSTVSAGTLGAGAWAALTRDATTLLDVAAQLRALFDAPRVVLTDRGTSALVLALRLAVGDGGAVAYPGFACVDLAAAARFTGVRVRVYDIDPVTLSPDIDSLRRATRRGVRAIVVAHLHGYPSDMRAVREVAAEAGVPVIEDAAQGAGGTFDGRQLGSFGNLTIVSFGRGKGTTGGHGGALLAADAAFDDRLARAMAHLGTPPRGARALFAAGAQWVFGRPLLYGIPSRVPWLHMGEMVYRPAHAPRALSTASAAMVRRALRVRSAEVIARRRIAAALTVAAEEGGDLTAVRIASGGEGGYLRFAVRDSGGRGPRPALGVLRGYPRTVLEQEEIGPCLAEGEPPTPGADQLRRELFTLPTHRFVTKADLNALVEWLRVPRRMMVPFGAGAESLEAMGSRK